MKEKRLGIVIAVCIQAGGAVKSTMTFNLAKNLASSPFNFKTCALDNDVQSDLMKMFFGVDEKGDTRIPQEILRKEDNRIIIGDSHTYNMFVEGASVVPYQINNNISYIGSTKQLSDILEKPFDVAAYEFCDKVQELRDKFDFIIIDCLPTECLMQKAALMAADYLLIPTLPNSKTISAIGSTLQTANRQKRFNKNLTLLGIVLNRYKKQKNLIQLQKAYIEMLHDLYGNELLKSSISESIRVEESATLGLSVIEYSEQEYKGRIPQAKEFLDLTYEILDKIGVKHG